MRGRLTAQWQAWAALALLALAALRPLGAGDATGALVAPEASGARLAAALILAGAAFALTRRAAWADFVLAAATHAAAFFLLAELSTLQGRAAAGFWALLAASWLLAWLLAVRLVRRQPANRTAAAALRLAVPLLFGVWLLILWEGGVRGAGVPFVLLPPPSAIGARMAGSLPILAADFRQTFLKAVLAGYLIGSTAGFLVALIADRIPFLGRGLLPIGNFVSALPIIGIAPITVMWFGFDWQSKAAVVVVMTFFPMLVNTVAGLQAANAQERDLMRTYAAGYWQALVKMRLPAALPFVFNALKINSTLALIGAIVAEFFGTPIVGMGFRISTEVGRMNIDMVWAEIAVAALAGSLFYGLVTVVERLMTFWHPSFRS